MVQISVLSRFSFYPSTYSRLRIGGQQHSVKSVKGALIPYGQRQLQYHSASARSKQSFRPLRNVPAHAILTAAERLTKINQPGAINLCAVPMRAGHALRNAKQTADHPTHITRKAVHHPLALRAAVYPRQSLSSFCLPFLLLNEFVPDGDVLIPATVGNRIAHAPAWGKAAIRAAKPSIHNMITTVSQFSEHNSSRFLDGECSAKARGDIFFLTQNSSLPPTTHGNC